MKKTWSKRAAVAAGLVLAVLCALWIGLTFDYNVQADNGNLADRAVQFLNRGAEVPAGEEVRVYDAVDLGKEKYVLIEYVQAGEAQLGIVYLEKGLNGRYKIDHVSWGGGNFREEVVEANYQKYYLFGGRNAVFGIAKVKIVLEGRTYNLDIPEGDHFLVCEEIDYTIRDTHCDVVRSRFYDGGGEDITNQVPWN